MIPRLHRVSPLVPGHLARSCLVIEARDGRSPALAVKDLPLRNVLSRVLSSGFEEEFFHWVADNANDTTWVSWISEQWQPVDFD